MYVFVFWSRDLSETFYWSSVRQRNVFTEGKKIVAISGIAYRYSMLNRGYLAVQIVGSHLIWCIAGRIVVSLGGVSCRTKRFTWSRYIIERLIGTIRSRNKIPCDTNYPLDNENSLKRKPKRKLHFPLSFEPTRKISDAPARGCNLLSNRNFFLWITVKVGSSAASKGAKYWTRGGSLAETPVELNWGLHW